MSMTDVAPGVNVEDAVPVPARFEFTPRYGFGTDGVVGGSRSLSRCLNPEQVHDAVVHRVSGTPAGSGGTWNGGSPPVATDAVDGALGGC